jgi:outer membrane protein TolC
MTGLIIRQMKRIQIVLLSVLLFQGLNAQYQNLDYYLAQGLKNSPLLKDYQNRVKSAIIDSMRLRAGLGIQVNASSANSYAPVIQGWGYDEVKTDIYQVSALVEISKEITANGNLRNKYQAIRLQNQSTLLEGNLSGKELKKAIVSQYILAYRDQQQHILNTEVLDVLRQEEHIVKKLTEQSIYKQTEYLSLLVNLKQQELITAQSKYQFKTDFESLNYLCGIVDTASSILSDPDLIVITPAEPRKTIFYKQFETDSLKLINTDRQIDFDYRPKLSVYADGGYLSSMVYSPWKNFGLSAGLSITVPIYDGQQKKMQHDQVAISEATRSNYLSFYTSQYRQQIAMLTRQLNSNEQLARQTSDQMAYAQALVDANRLLLNSGDISITDYLLSINNYLTAKNLLIENTLIRFSILNEINYWNDK